MIATRVRVLNRVSADPIADANTKPEWLTADDGLRQFAVTRLKQLLEQADALFDGNLEDVADHPGVNSQHRVDVDASSSSQLDKRLTVDPCLTRG